MLIPISSNSLEELKLKARQSKRLRKNYNFHKHPEDTLQRMLHAMNPGTYVQPHKHENPDKREAFIILEGKVAVIAFDDSGRIVEFFILDSKKGNYGVEIPEQTWHMLIALEENSVIYEVKDGPYSPQDDKNFAPWAPKEGDKACQFYLESVQQQLAL
jgi:cupin fold WbuC family metalloprotein